MLALMLLLLLLLTFHFSHSLFICCRVTSLLVASLWRRRWT
jgi:hypothetical protein